MENSDRSGGGHGENGSTTTENGNSSSNSDGNRERSSPILSSGIVPPTLTRRTMVSSLSSSSSAASMDLPNQIGSTLDVSDFRYGGVQEPGMTEPYLMRRQWEVNYREAAIFLDEGMNNDKFTHHPRSREALPAYLLVHNKAFNLIDLGASVVLLLIAFFEQPCLETLAIPAVIHAGIELCSLILIAIQVFLKTRWVGWTNFYKHKRTLIKVTTLGIMLIECVVVMIRNTSHFRVTRALRPLFVIDNHYCWGVRRFIRQILQSLPPILDMLGLVFFVMLIYSVFGFYLFSKDDPENFQTLVKSFISLFVLLTTANYPDVMMKSYNNSRWSAVFFISYLAINLYFLMNLMLAVVYDAFTRIEKEKFRRLFLHKRKAAQHAFKLLVTKERPNQIGFPHFRGLINFYKSSATDIEAYLIFKLLNKDNNGYLNMSEFYGVYDACIYNWNYAKKDYEWYGDCNPILTRILNAIRKMVTSTWFEYTVCAVVLTNGIILIVQTSVMSSTDDEQSIYAPWVSYFFVGLYTMEAVFKLLGLGFQKYFASYWNHFDFLITTLGILSLIFEYLGIPLFYVIILRPLRLLTLFRMKKRFRDVFGTAVILYPRLTSAVIVLILIYYFFAIIGMECFHNADLFNCCKNTTVEQFYKYEEGSASNAYYYLNNFNSLSISGVTLFELTVVNNWFIIMEGYAIVSSEWSRLFFMSFYVFTMIVMTIIVAFILEAFLFRIQYKQFLSKEDEIKKLSGEVYLSTGEMEYLLCSSSSLPGNSPRDSLERGEEGPPRSSVPQNALFRFVGTKSRTRAQLQQLMYADEMDIWIAEAQREETNDLARARASRILMEGGSLLTCNEDESVQIVNADSQEDATTITRRVITDNNRS